MKKQLPVVPTAIVGIVLLVIIAIGVNVVASRTPLGSARLDLTENKIYTLSEGTRNILTELDTPVTIRFYYTEGARALPRNLKLFANRVRDFLRQYETISEGTVQFEYVNTQPDTDEEDSARLDQIQSQDISVTETVFFGISISSLDQKQSIPRLSLQDEPLLEYYVSRAITQVVSPDKPRLGLMTSLPMQGNGMPPQMGGQQGWVIVQQLELDYEVVPVDPAATEIPDDLDALLVVHPGAISRESEYALDQYLLAGGKMAVFLDAHYYFNQPPQQANPMMPAQGMAPTSSTLPTLLAKWGINFESGLVVADQTQRFSRQGRVLTGVSAFTGDSLDDKDPVISNLEDVFMILPGGFTGEPAVPTVHKTVLVRTSSKTQLLDGQRASQFDQTLLTEVPTTNKSYDMVLRLVGRFPTAFPDGPPGADEVADENGENDEVSTEDNADSGHLKEPVGEGAVVLFADVDMIANEGAFQSNPLVPQVVQPYNGNFSLMLNVLEQLTGNSNLITARSRPSSRRPFTEIEALQASAEAAARDKINELVAVEKEVQEKISTLRADQITDDGEIRLDASQQAAIRDALQKQTEVRRELRDLRKELAKEKDRLEARYTLANILVMPLIVVLFGLGVAAYRKTRTAAR